MLTAHHKLQIFDVCLSCDEIFSAW